MVNLTGPVSHTVFSNKEDPPNPKRVFHEIYSSAHVSSRDITVIVVFIVVAIVVTINRQQRHQKHIVSYKDQTYGFIAVCRLVT